MRGIIMKKAVAALASVSLAAFVLAAPAPVLAQAPVQQSAVHVDACNEVSTSTNFATTGQQLVATFAVNASQFAYICSISFEVCTNGTGTAQNQVTFTSTGINNTPSWSYSIAATASICQRWQEVFPLPLKGSAAGTNVVVTSPSAATNNSYGVRIYGYLGNQ